MPMYDVQSIFNISLTGKYFQIPNLTAVSGEGFIYGWFQEINDSGKSAEDQP